MPRLEHFEDEDGQQFTCCPRCKEWKCPVEILCGIACDECLERERESYERKQREDDELFY